MKFYQCITDFIFVADEPKPSDIIFVPGGNYPEAALLAAELYKKGYAPYILPSGKYSILAGKFDAPQSIYSETSSGTVDYETECDYLCAVLQQEGVPEHALIRENQATFTYENACYSRKRVKELGLKAERALLCCQAFHARRCLMYYQEQFPETQFYVCPVVTKRISRDTWYQSELGIETVLGELERCGRQFHEIMREYVQQAL